MDSIWLSCFLSQGLQLLKDSIEECWDEDEESRLDARCLQERMEELLTHPDDATVSTEADPSRKELPPGSVTRCSSSSFSSTLRRSLSQDISYPERSARLAERTVWWARDKLTRTEVWWHPCLNSSILLCCDGAKNGQFLIVYVRSGKHCWCEPHIFPVGSWERGCKKIARSNEAKKEEFARQKNIKRRYGFLQLTPDFRYLGSIHCLCLVDWQKLGGGHQSFQQ